MNTPEQSTPARWHEHALAAWGTIRELREQLAGTREVLHAAVHLLHERGVEHDRVRQRYHHVLNDERRKWAA
jgi:hypothetical protein